MWLLMMIPLSMTPACDGFRLSPDSPARNAGVWIQGLHCPQAGFNDSGCVEWFETFPDIGACEYIPPTAVLPAAPSGLSVTPGSTLVN